jgi:hypothetical protein
MEETQSKPIQLTFRSVEQVVVEPDDQDRFVTTAQEAARACQQAQAGKDWSGEFNRFLSSVHEWCVGHQDRIESCYVDIGDGGLRVSVCVDADDFDFEFDDEITEFDIKLAEMFPNVLSEVTQIPRQVSLRVELPSSALCVYGDGERTSRAGGS